MASQLAQRWADPVLVEARKWVSRQGDPTDPEVFARKFQSLWRTKADELWEVLREPDFFEDLAILEKRGHLDAEILEDSLGAIVPERWRRWSGAIAWRIETTGNDKIYCNFKALVDKLEAREAAEKKKSARRAARRCPWPEPEGKKVWLRIVRLFPH